MFQVALTAHLPVCPLVFCRSAQSGIRHPPSAVPVSLPSRFDAANAEIVASWFRAGAEALLSAGCRQHSIDIVAAPGTLIATGDLHDNPGHFATLMAVAGLSLDASPPHDPPAAPGCTHLLLHELIHGDRLVNGLDFSYRTLARVAQLKAIFPERVHVVLGNHELSQIVGAGIVKDGVRVVEAFNAGVEYVFGGSAGMIHDAIADFVRAMPIALAADTPRGRILCSHSLPSAMMMAKFDPSLLSRDLVPGDYEPRTGAAHLMVWGRGYDLELLEDLVERWGVSMFILGHDKIEEGARFVPPNALVLNSDHANGVYVPIDLANPASAEQLARCAVRLSPC